MGRARGDVAVRGACGLVEAGCEACELVEAIRWAVAEARRRASVSWVLAAAAVAAVESARTLAATACCAAGEAHLLSENHSSVGLVRWAGIVWSEAWDSGRKCCWV